MTTLASPRTTFSPSPKDSFSGKRFVVLSTGLDKYERGDVIDDVQACGGFVVRDGEKIPVMDDEDRYNNISRLLQLRAIRLASSFEAAKDKVDVTNPGRPEAAAWEEQIAQKDKQLDDAFRRVRELEAEIRAIKGVVIPPPPDDTRKYLDLIEAKDKRIMDLEARLTNLTSAQEKTDAKSQEGTKKPGR